MAVCVQIGGLDKFWSIQTVYQTAATSIEAHALARQQFNELYPCGEIRCEVELDGGCNPFSSVQFGDCQTCLQPATWGNPAPPGYSPGAYRYAVALHRAMLYWVECCTRSFCNLPFEDGGTNRSPFVVTSAQLCHDSGSIISSGSHGARPVLDCRTPPGFLYVPVQGFGLGGKLANSYTYAACSNTEECALCSTPFHCQGIAKCCTNVDGTHDCRGVRFLTDRECTPADEGTSGGCRTHCLTPIAGGRSSGPCCLPTNVCQAGDFPLRPSPVCMQNRFAISQRAAAHGASDDLEYSAALPVDQSLNRCDEVYGSLVTDPLTGDIDLEICIPTGLDEQTRYDQPTRYRGQLHTDPVTGDIDYLMQYGGWN